MKTEQKRKAIALRKRGGSLKEIAQKIGVAKSTVSLWTRDIPIPHKKNAERLLRGTIARTKECRESRLAKQQEGREKAREGDLLHQAGCMLYWAEGYKHKNTLRFTNTDEHMLKLFCKFLVASINVPKGDIYVEVQFHDGVAINKPEEVVKRFWEKTLRLPVRAAKKIKPRGGGKKNRHPFGIATIHVKKSTDYCQHIYGAIQEYASFNTGFGLD